MLQLDSLQAGQIIDDRYKIINLLGQGGMGVVYKAEQLEFGRVVALKLLRTDLIGDSESQSRFVREAQALSRLSHKFIGTFYSYGFWQNKIPYISMEFIEGKSLSALLNEREKLSWQEAAGVVRFACQALEHSHSNSIVHRDIKPNNIILCSRDEGPEIKILDFGLAKVIGSEQNLQKLTQTGALLGSAEYMSPELCRGEASDHRTDIYSLACVFYQCLTGRPPHEADNPIGLLHKHINEDIVPPSKTGSSDLPEGLDEILIKGLAKDKDKRYRSMKELEADISLILQNRGKETLAFRQLKPETGAAATSFKHKKLVFSLLFVAGILIAGLTSYLNHPAGIESQINIQLRSAPNISSLNSANRLLQKLLITDKTHKNIGHLQNKMLEYAKSISPIQAIELCNTLMQEDKDRELSLASRGLSLLSSAPLEPVGNSRYVDLAENFSKVCLKHKERKSGLTASVMDAVDARLRSADINYKFEFLKLYVQTLRQRKGSANLIQNLTYLGGIYSKRHDLHSARAAFKEAEAECGKLQNPDQQLIELYIKEAQFLFKSGYKAESEQALYKADRVLRKVPEDLIEQQAYYASVARECGEIETAKRYALHGLELARRKLALADAPFRETKFFFNSLMTRSKLEVQKRSAALGKTSCDFARVLLDCYQSEGDLKNAQSLYDSVFSSDPFWQNARNSTRFESFLVGCLCYDKISESKENSLEEATTRWLAKKLDFGEGRDEQIDLQHYFDVYKFRKANSRSPAAKPKSRD